MARDFVSLTLLMQVLYKYFVMEKESQKKKKTNKKTPQKLLYNLGFVTHTHADLLKSRPTGRCENLQVIGPVLIGK